MRWSCLLWWLLAEMIPRASLAEKRKLPTTPSETIDGQELLQHLRRKKEKTADPLLENAGIGKLTSVTNDVSGKDDLEDKKTTVTKKMGLVVIPGLGRADRLDTVLHNLRMLAGGGYLTKRTVKKSRQGQKNNRPDQSNENSSPTSQNQLWDCVIYIYADRKDPKTADFFAETDKLAMLAKYCELREYPNQFVTTNMWMVKPWDVQGIYTYVFVLLDDIKLLPSQPQNPSQLQSPSQNPSQTTSRKKRLKSTKMFDLSLLLSIMQRNNLTAASPMVIGANTGAGQAFRTIMQRPAVAGTNGYVSLFVELFAWMGTVTAYEALWEILYPSVNPFGWGHDFWYPQYGLANVPNHRTGIVSVMKVSHIQDFSAPNGGRTDTTSVADKWGAVMAQERFYKTHFQIDLKRCRERLGLHNSSWNGAVTGYLY